MFFNVGNENIFFFNFINYTEVPMLHFQGVFYRIIVQSQSVKIMWRDEQHNKTTETTKYKFKKRGLGTFFFFGLSIRNTHTL